MKKGNITISSDHEEPLRIGTSDRLTPPILIGEIGEVNCENGEENRSRFGATLKRSEDSFATETSMSLCSSA